MKAAKEVSLYEFYALFLEDGNLETFSQLLAYFRGKKHAVRVITFLDLQQVTAEEHCARWTAAAALAPNHQLRYIY